MSELLLQDVRLQYGDFVAIDGVSLQVAAGEVVAVLGPSGCGKSSLLRAVAGLEPLSSGAITLAGRDLAGVPVHKRGVGLMFADHALFSHLDVAGNVAFGLRMARWPRQQQEQRVAEMLALVGLADRASSPIAELSGGQQQRVALARTLAPRPEVVLLDEPMSSLDRALRRELREMLAASLAETGATALLVTHDRDEALQLGHRVAVMRSGRLVQVAPGRQLLAEPADDWVADFLADDPLQQLS